MQRSHLVTVEEMGTQTSNRLNIGGVEREHSFVETNGGLLVVQHVMDTRNPKHQARLAWEHFSVCVLSKIWNSEYTGIAHVASLKRSRAVLGRSRRM